jgi:hypothetical protein
MSPKAKGAHLQYNTNVWHNSEFWATISKKRRPSQEINGPEKIKNVTRVLNKGVVWVAHIYGNRTTTLYHWYILPNQLNWPILGNHEESLDALLPLQSSQTCMGSIDAANN